MENAFPAVTAVVIGIVTELSVLVQGVFEN